MSSLALALSFSYAGIADSFSVSQSLSTTQVGVGVLLQNQTIGTTSEALDLGDLANVQGGLCIKNLDETNYVEIDSASTFDKWPQKILPGGCIFVSSQTVTLYAKAHTAPVNITVAAAVA